LKNSGGDFVRRGRTVVNLGNDKMVGTVEGKPERTLARGYLDEWPGRSAVAGDGVGLNLFVLFSVTTSVVPSGVKLI
jgi:hypothetical protein